MRLLVTGGGTGGHIYPALSVVREMQRRHNDLVILYVGTERGMEADIVPKEGLPFATVSSRGFRRRLSLDTLKTVAVATKGVWEARSVIRRFRPDVVLGTGGYVAGPVVLQAALMGIPCLIHEQNALPSVTNRLLARFVRQVALSFSEAKRYLPPKTRVIVTGNPVRPEVFEAKRDDGQREFGLDPRKKTLLVVGGSRGAEPINEAVVGMLAKVASAPDQQLLFVTGSAHYEGTLQRVRGQGLNLEKVGNIIIKPYLYNMPLALAAADLIIARSGGMIAEITAIGLPAILIPSPHVADNHQEHNARAAEDAGVGLMIREHELTSERLWDDCQKILIDEERLREMQRASLAYGKPQATDRICNALESLAKQNRRR